MQLLDTRTYIAELAAAGRRHGALLTLFKKFSEHAKHVAAKEYPLKGIAIAPDGSTGFTARFLDVGARFTFVHDSESGLGVIHVSDVSMGDSEPSPFWSIHFNETGEVQDIESRRNEGAYNVGIDTDAAEIVLAAVHKLISKPSGPEALVV
ncbi:MAG TPA: hypothetical protein VGL25_08980 [Casimicrobiaceae bacterium]|jgi:hypothetical protein